MPTDGLELGASTKERHARAGRSTTAVVRRPFLDVGVASTHLAVLSAFALAQPLFDLLSKNAEFFVVRGSTKWDIILFALGVTFVPPLVLGIVELIAGIFDARLQRGLQLLFVAALVGLFAAQALKRIDSLSSTEMLAGAALLAVAGAIVYWRARLARRFLTVLSPAPLLFLLLFLFASPVSKLTLAHEARASVSNVAVATTSTRPRIVMIVFDEFPETSLMDNNRNIDRVRYPHLAELARGATWFRNATTVSGSTTYAVPAVMTGIYPSKGKLANFHDHPQNIFTLLGGGYRLNVVESQTHLCPRQLCKTAAKAPHFTSRLKSLYSDVDVIYLHLVSPPKLEARLPDISSSWLNFRHGGADTEASTDKTAVVEVKRGRQKEFWRGRRAVFKKFLSSIKPSTRPTLDFIHVLLPHGPWEYFADGTQYAQIPGFGSARTFDTWEPDRLLVLQTYERHLLQVGFVDQLIGQLVARLRRIGVYDQSLLLVMADHGISFRPGDRRRGPTATNLEDIAFPPLLVKLPGQQQGSINDAHVQSIDVLPTIADVLNISIPWAVDGHSAFKEPYPSAVRLPVDRIVTDVGPLEQKRDAAIRRKTALFGSGRGAAGLFAIAPHRELVGRRVSTLPAAQPSRARATLNRTTQRLLQAVNPGSGYVPALIGGNIIGGGPGLTLAIAVNGRIATLTRSYSLSGNVRYAALVPESSLRRGANHVEVLSVAPSGGGVVLSSLGFVS